MNILKGFLFYQRISYIKLKAISNFGPIRLYRDFFRNIEAISQIQLELFRTNFKGISYIKFTHGDTEYHGCPLVAE